MGSPSEEADHAEDLRAAGNAFLTASRALMGISVRSVAASPVPLTVPQHRLLVLVAADGPRRVGTLADDLGVNQSNASRLVDRLCRLGLVRRVRDLEDGRASMVELTPSGRDVLEEVNSHRLHAVMEVLQEISPETRFRAVEALREFNDAAHEADAIWWPS
jgi:DNA-binding MarR family transcriptional regulator